MLTALENWTHTSRSDMTWQNAQAYHTYGALHEHKNTDETVMHCTVARELCAAKAGDHDFELDLRYAQKGWRRAGRWRQHALQITGGREEMLFGSLWFVQEDVRILNTSLLPQSSRSSLWSPGFHQTSMRYAHYLYTFSRISYPQLYYL